MAAYPAGIRAYDLLLDGEDDLRALPFASGARGWRRCSRARRAPRIDLSPLQPFASWDELRAPARRAARAIRGAEGLMLKRWDRSMRPAGRRARGSSGSAIRT